jgi:hypothetical protein
MNPAWLIGKKAQHHPEPKQAEVLPGIEMPIEPPPSTEGEPL